MRSLKDETVLITGGGSGIGLAVARLLLDQGARVAIAGRTPARLEQAVASLGGGDRLIARAADVADPTQAQELVRATLERFGSLGLLINNAGVNVKERTMSELTPQSWRLLLGGNLEGAFHCMQAVLPHMRQRRRGLIINVNSISGKRANPLGGAGYNAAKFALTGLATSVGAEEKGHGIRVSSIFPGEVDTPILEHRPTPVSDEHRRQILRPEDVAAAVLFVAGLPESVNIPELIITPASYAYI